MDPYDLKQLFIATIIEGPANFRLYHGNESVGERKKMVGTDPCFFRYDHGCCTDRPGLFHR